MVGTDRRSGLLRRRTQGQRRLDGSRLRNFAHNARDFFQSGAGQVVKAVGMAAVSAIPGVGPAALAGLKGVSTIARGFMAPENELVMTQPVVESDPGANPFTPSGQVGIQLMTGGGPVRRSLADKNLGDELQRDPNLIMREQNTDWIHAMTGGMLDRQSALRLAGQGIQRMVTSADMHPALVPMARQMGAIIGNNLPVMAGPTLTGRPRAIGPAALPANLDPGQVYMA